ncbi:MAG: NfeD family protein [Clostridiales bacterium]
MKKFLPILFLCMICILSSVGVAAANEKSDDKPNVYVVQIDSEIDNTTVDLVEKAIKEANLGMADLLIVEVNTYGGYIDSAISIKDDILTSPIPIVTFVNKQALSAGSLISVAGEKLFMSPGSTIGAAEARLGEEKADEKTMSAWVSELKSTAEARGKDPDIMAAMADDTIAIEGLVEKGRLLTLSDAQALKYGISDGSMKNYGEISTAMGVDMGTVQMVEASGLEKFAAFICNPVVSGMLISIGLLGIIIELLTTAFGVAGVVGVCSFALYFTGHMVVNSAGWVAVVLFILGVVLMIIEGFVTPGFGIPGIAGGISVLASIYLVSSSWQVATISIIVALIVACIIVGISMKNKKTRGIWKKFILHDKTDNESGYTSPNMDNMLYMGKEGVSLTPLRPAGEVDIEGNRVDVVTEGDFIEVGVKVLVTALDGTRIIVKRVIN